MESIKKIGILGGSFDPPHEGHLEMARTASKKFDLDRILFVPCHQNPLKDITGYASPYHRYVMTQLATLVEPNFLVTPLEITRKGKSYTIDTLKDIAKTGFEMYLLMGMDSFRTLDKWKDSERFSEFCRIIVFTREEKVRKADIPAEFADITSIVTGFNVDISSTELRKKIRKGENLDREIPPILKVYIEKYELYLHFRDQKRLVDEPLKDYFIGEG